MCDEIVARSGLRSHGDAVATAKQVLGVRRRRGSERQVAGGFLLANKLQRGRPCGLPLRRWRRRSRFAAAAADVGPSEGGAGGAVTAAAAAASAGSASASIGIGRRVEQRGADRSLDRALVVAPPGELGLALLEHRDQRGADEDRGVRTRADPDQQREGEVLECGAAEQEQREDRQQRDEVVASDLGIVSQSDTFPITRNDARFISGMFSRMRSKMMIVS